MRACNCPGMLEALRVAFADRVRAWERLGSRRPFELAVHLSCPVCHKLWRLQLLELGVFPAR